MPYIDNFYSYTGPLINKISDMITKNEISREDCIKEMDEVVSKLEYRFNRNVILKLKNQVSSQYTQVNENQSFLYIVKIKNQKIVDHALVFEMYLSPVTKKPRIRVYQAWVKIVLLVKDMENRGYQEGDEGTMDLDGFNNFIELFQNVYEPNASRSLESYKKCFGYADTFPPLVELVKKGDKRILNGLNVSYISVPFSPQKCFENLAEIFQTLNHEEEIDGILKTN